MSFFTKIRDLFHPAHTPSSSTTTPAEPPPTQINNQETVVTLAKNVLQQPQEASQKRTLPDVSAFQSADLTEPPIRVRKNETSPEVIEKQVARAQQTTGAFTTSVSLATQGPQIELQPIEAADQTRKAQTHAEQQRVVIEKLKADFMIRIAVCHWNVWRSFTRLSSFRYYTTLQQERGILEQEAMKATSKEELVSLLTKTKETFHSWEKIANESAQPFLVEACAWTEQKMKELDLLQS